MENEVEDAIFQNIEQTSANLPWYEKGTIAFQYNNWKGMIRYHGSSNGPIYSLKSDDGKETAEGTIDSSINLMLMQHSIDSENFQSLVRKIHHMVQPENFD